MSCAVSTLSTRCAGGILLAGCGCGRWSCGDCARYKVRRIVGRIVDGDPCTFMTFGWDTKRPESIERARQVMGEKWGLLVAMIRRRYPDHEFHYFVAVERFQNGYPHFHVLARTGFIDQKWLSKKADALWGAPVVDIRKIRTVFGCSSAAVSCTSRSKRSAEVPSD